MASTAKAPNTRRTTLAPPHLNPRPLVSIHPLATFLLPPWTSSCSGHCPGTIPHCRRWWETSFSKSLTTSRGYTLGSKTRVPVHLRPQPIRGVLSNLACTQLQDEAQGEGFGDGSQDSQHPHREVTQWRLLLLSLTSSLLPPASGWKAVSSVLLLGVLVCNRRRALCGHGDPHCSLHQGSLATKKKKCQLNYPFIRVIKLVYILFWALYLSNKQFSAYSVMNSCLFCGLRISVMPSFLPVWLLMFKASFRNSKNLSSLSYLAFQDYCFSCDFKTTSFDNPIDFSVPFCICRHPKNSFKKSSPRDWWRKANIDTFVLISFLIVFPVSLGRTLRSS